MPVSLKRVLALVFALVLALALSACAKTVSTSDYQGEEKQVAQTIANLQTDVTAGNEKKVCSNDLASVRVKALDASPGGCQQAVKNQLAEIDNFEVNVGSIHVNGTTATASVLSVNAGKKRPVTISLVKEGGKWKISGES
jgi:YbbR domain-containing protein